MSKRVFIVAAALFVLTACAPQGNAAPAPNSIAAARATNEAEDTVSPEIVTTAPPIAAAVADAVEASPAAQPIGAMNQAEPGLDRLFVALAVIVGIPLFWMLSLKFFRTIRRAQRTA